MPIPQHLVVQLSSTGPLKDKSSQAAGVKKSAPRKDWPKAALRQAVSELMQAQVSAFYCCRSWQCRQHCLQWCPTVRPVNAASSCSINRVIG